jgi:hypothetical protein
MSQHPTSHVKIRQGTASCTELLLGLFGWGLGMHQQKCQVVCMQTKITPNLSTWCSGQSTLLYTASRSARRLLQATTLVRASSTCCRVGSAGIAPLSVTVRAPQTFANFKASLNRPSSCFSHKEYMSGFKAPVHSSVCVGNKEIPR